MGPGVVNGSLAIPLALSRLLTYPLTHARTDTLSHHSLPSLTNLLTAGFELTDELDVLRDGLDCRHVAWRRGRRDKHILPDSRGGMGSTVSRWQLGLLRGLISEYELSATDW